MPKRKFTQYVAVPVHMMGTLPDLTKFSSERRVLTETNLTLDLTLVAIRNCQTIDRLQTALAMRRQKGMQHAHR